MTQFIDYSLFIYFFNRAFIRKPFLGREASKNIEPVNLDMLCNKIDANKSEYIENSNEICSKILSEVTSGDVIIIFGAGESYKLSRKIIDVLKEKTMFYNDDNNVI